MVLCQLDIILKQIKLDSYLIPTKKKSKFKPNVRGKIIKFLEESIEIYPYNIRVADIS